MIAETLPTVAMPIRTPALAWILLTILMDPERLVVTSIGDSVHAADSAHYRGEAVDLRSHDLATMIEKRQRQSRLANTLGPHFSVQLEPYDVAGSVAAEHLHVQLNHGILFSIETLTAHVHGTWITPSVGLPTGTS